MSDSEYLTRAEAALAAIERTLDDTEADIEFERSGNVLTLEFENGTKIIVNLQPPMQENLDRGKRPAVSISALPTARGTTPAAAPSFSLRSLTMRRSRPASRFVSSRKRRRNQRAPANRLNGRGTGS